MAYQRILLASALAASLVLTGCATTEASRSIETPSTASVLPAYQGARVPVSIGKFDNRSDFMRALFSDGNDRLGGQAQTIMISHLQQSGRFAVMDRQNLQAAQQESALANRGQQLRAARYLVTGDVTEFGRKTTGDHQLFGLLGRGKSQIAYAKVTVNLVDVQTGEVVYSTQGAGEFSLSNREVIGFGSTAAYDSTLNGKVLDLAIREAVQKLSLAVDTGAWRPAL